MLALITEREDQYAYSEQNIVHYCNKLAGNWLFNGGYFEQKLKCYCPCSPYQSRWREKYNIGLKQEGCSSYSDECCSKKVFNSLQDLMQHLNSNEGYFHFATKIYCQILHDFEKKKRSQNRNRNRNQATNSGTWFMPPNLESNAGRAIRQEGKNHQFYQQGKHVIGNKRPRNGNGNRNRATNSGGWSLAQNLESNAGRAIRQQGNNHQFYQQGKNKHQPYPRDKYSKSARGSKGPYTSSSESDDNDSS